MSLIQIRLMKECTSIVPHLCNWSCCCQMKTCKSFFFRREEEEPGQYWITPKKTREKERKREVEWITNLFLNVAFLSLQFHLIIISHNLGPGTDFRLCLGGRNNGEEPGGQIRKPSGKPNRVNRIVDQLLGTGLERDGHGAQNDAKIACAFPNKKEAVWYSDWHQRCYSTRGT